ncbi:MAG: hypothetical protein QOE45_1843 [Frankiaceae bacterium]|nr:hypothetical protein [Frankiaceae bacterium]
MELLNRLRRLDGRLVPGFRRPGESAEAFLRRTAAQRWGIAWSTDQVKYALREYFAELDRAAGGRT